MDNLAAVVLFLGLVGKETAVLSEESLPVAGNILHPQVVDDEFRTPAGRERNRKSN